MKKTEMKEIIDVFQKWYNKSHTNDYTSEEAKLIDCYGYEKVGVNQLVAFWAGYKIAAKEAVAKARKDGLTCGIAYSVGFLRRYGVLACESQYSKFLLDQSGVKSKSELRAAGCKELDIESIGDLLPETQNDVL
jgi:hypothetical protein